MDEAYSEAQIASLVALLRKLQGQLPSLRQVAGHGDSTRVPRPLRTIRYRYGARAAIPARCSHGRACWKQCGWSGCFRNPGQAGRRYSEARRSRFRALRRALLRRNLKSTAARAPGPRPI
jgi:hypothetical protein